MAEKIQGNNDRERLFYIAKTYGSTAKIPKSEISSTSENGSTVITVQGTKVNDALLADALKEDKARAAAARAASGVPEGLVSRDEVQAMIDAAVQKALADSKQPPPGK
jgi:hypothetical protein